MFVARCLNMAVDMLSTRMFDQVRVNSTPHAHV